jgi:hypothetical protein
MTHERVEPMPLEDKTLRHTIQREVAKFAQSIDDTLMTVAVINGVVYLGGRIRPIRGTAGRGVDVKKQVFLMKEVLERTRGVTQVVVDAIVEEHI